MKKNYLKIIIISFLALSLANCDGEDGANGINGGNGADGENGIDGENGVGFGELTQFGSITVTFEGTRPDDVVFSDTSEFKFTAIEGDELSNNSGVEIDESEISFDLVRFLSAPDDVYQETTVEIDLDITNPGQEDESTEFTFEIDDYAIISDDFTFFVLDDGSYDNDGAGVSNFSITNYNYNEESHNLTFSFSFEVAGDNNDTGNDLKISGEVNVIVLEEIAGDTPPPPPTK